MQQAVVWHNITVYQRQQHCILLLSGFDEIGYHVILDHTVLKNKSNN